MGFPDSDMFVIEVSLVLYLSVYANSTLMAILAVFGVCQCRLVIVIRHVVTIQ